MRVNGNPAVMLNWVSALRDCRGSMLSFYEDLTPDEWTAPSLAAGWSVQDVLAHLGSGCHAMFGPAMLRLIRSSDIEATNDDFVEQRRSWSSSAVLAEYRTWSRHALRAAGLASRWPLRTLRVPLAELGAFDARLLLCGALTFDHYTHLRHDLAPALNRTVPAPSGQVIAIVLEWMLAVLGNQIARADFSWLDTGVGVILEGAGGGSWVIDRRGVRRAHAEVAHTRIVGAAIDFPSWATTRTDWRSHSMRLEGSQELAIRLLENVNVV